MYQGLYRFAKITSLVTSEASFESSASQSGSFVHFWQDASTIRCPNSHLVFVGLLLSVVGDLAIVGELAIVGDLDCLVLLVV